MTDINPSPLGKRHVITTELVARMREVQENELITYQQICEVTRLSKDKSYSYVNSARAILESEYAMVFTNETNIGYRRLKNNEIPEYSTRHHVRKLKNNAKRFRGKLQAVDTTQLSQQQQISYTLGVANLNMMESLADSRTQRSIKKQIASSQDAMKALDKKALMESLQGFG